MVGTSYASSNRFTALHPDNQNGAKKKRNRSRSNSSRRNDSQNNQQQQEAQAPTPKANVAHIEIDCEILEKCRSELADIATLCEKIDLAMMQIEGEQTPLMDVLGGLTMAIRSFGSIHDAMLKSAKEPPPSYAKVAKGNGNAKPPAKQNRPQVPLVVRNFQCASNTAPPSDQTSEHSGGPRIQVSDEHSENDRKYYRFKDVIKEAEKSTLIFNLNLGKFPIMDVNTMSTRSSLALSSMAAKVEKMPTNHPSDEARETLDDVMGVVKKVHFYGRQTRSYINPKDKKSGSYCTVPVRYDFSDRDMRIRAEKILRERCDVNCTTPYPLVVRECMKRTAAATKAVYPDHNVRINVDAHNFCLRIGIRAANEKVFHWIPKPVQLPALALDTDLKKLPRDFDFAVQLLPRNPTSEISQTIPPPVENTNANAGEPAPMDGADAPPV